MRENFKSRLKGVSTLLFGLDGVLTDGKLYYSGKDTPGRSLHAKDAFALRLAAEKGYNIAVISSIGLGFLSETFDQLGVRQIIASDKLSRCLEYIKIHKKEPADVLYMGDDLPDYGIMEQIGVPVCPGDAAAEIKSISVYVSHQKGGEGCARDVIEQVLRAQGKWKLPYDNE